MLGKLAELVLFGIAPLALAGLFAPGAAVAEEITVAGEVTYRERIALPPNAVLTVQLADMSLPDAPAVAEQTVDPAGQVPIRFEIKFDGAVVRAEADYALQARITVDNKIWFMNDERHSVDPHKPEPLTMVLKRIDQDAAAEPSQLFGITWLAEDIGGRGVIDNAQSTFKVEPDGKVAGSGGCNRFFAEAEVKDGKISIGKAGATMMACAEALMDQERKFLAALEKAAAWRIDAQGKLFLVDAEGADVIRFANAG